MITSLRRVGMLLVTTGALVLGPMLAGAAPMTPYTKQVFADAQSAGKPIVLFVHASWCVTCRRQQPIVEGLTKDPAFADVLVLVVNYDRDKETLKELGVTDRSTLVAFKGKTERKRSSFVTDAAAIKALFESAL